MEFAGNRVLLGKSVPIGFSLHFVVNTNGDTIKMKYFTPSPPFLAGNYLFLLVVLVIQSSAVAEIINAGDVLLDQSIYNIRTDSVLLSHLDCGVYSVCTNQLTYCIHLALPNYPSSFATYLPFRRLFVLPLPQFQYDNLSISEAGMQSWLFTYNLYSALSATQLYTFLFFLRICEWNYENSSKHFTVCRFSYKQRLFSLVCYCQLILLCTY